MALRRIAVASVAVLALADCVLGLAVLRLRAQVADGALLGGALPKFSRTGGPWGAGCLLLRYSALRCPFCGAQTAGNWRRLASGAAALRCHVVVLAPYGGDLPLDGLRAPHQDLLTVTPQFAQVTRLSRAPTTFLALRHIVVWERVGVLTSADVRNARAALSRARRLGPLVGWLP